MDCEVNGAANGPAGLCADAGDPVCRGGPADHSSRLCDEIERLVARRFAVARSALRATGRHGGATALARHVAMYLQRVLLELTYEQVARRFLRHPTTVIYACRRVEALRDEQGFDRRVAAIEAAILDRAETLAS
jgi:hypothetical protein